MTLARSGVSSEKLSFFAKLSKIGLSRYRFYKILKQIPPQGSPSSSPPNNDNNIEYALRTRKKRSELRNKKLLGVVRLTNEESLV